MAHKLLASAALLLALGLAAPARATTTVISTATTTPVTINTGDEVDIVAGGSVTVASGVAVTVNGGTLNMTGGSVMSIDFEGLDAVDVKSGAATISGGTISGNSVGVGVSGGTVTLSGGSVYCHVHVSGGTFTLSGGSVTCSVDAVGGTAIFSGGSVGQVQAAGATVTLSGGMISYSTYGVIVNGGTLTVQGCDLTLINSQLTGFLQDGSRINTSVSSFVSGQPMLLNSSTGPPIIAAPASVTVGADPGQCSASNVDLGTPTTSNVCGVASVTNNAPDSFPVGDTTVTWTVTDTSGNTNSATQTVHVAAPPPLGFALGSATTGAGAGKAGVFLTDAGKCSASLNLTPPAATGGCGMVTVAGVRSDGAALTAPYPLGLTTITWTATDGQGTQATTTQGVTVWDREKPVFSNCPTTALAATATCTAQGTGALVSFSALSATDNCGTPTVSFDHPSGSCFAPGSTSVTATAMDAAANSATCAFMVSVTYAWSGFLPPINPSAVFKLGSTVPVIFQLTGASACLTTLAATFSATKQSSGVAGSVNAAGSTSAATSGNMFRYDPKSGQYIFNWSTKGLTAGTYQLSINLGDGVMRTVTVGLK